MRSSGICDAWTKLIQFHNYRMTKILFGCAATTIVAFVIVSLVTSLLAQDSTQPSYGIEQNRSSLYQNENGIEYADLSSDNEPKNDSTLFLVQVIFRHGDRSPMYSYPADPHKDEWPQGYGQLTKLGVLQGYQLGQFLRKHYSGFLGQEYKAEEVYIRSTNKDRTIMTAQSVAAGLFPYLPDAQESWPFGKWQPIPVYTMPQNLDKMLQPTKACSYVKDLKYGLNAYFYSKQSLMKNKVTMFALSEYSGLEMNFTTLFHLADTIYCQKVHNMTQPKWMRSSTEKELLSFHDLRPVLMPEEAKYLAGLLLDEMIDNAVSKAHNTSDNHKIYLYSAHKGNLHTLMSLLGVYHQGIVIPYTTAFILEFHSIDHKLFVKLLYREPDDPVPVTLSVPGCKDGLCPIHVLSDVFDEPAQKSWEEVCGVASQENVIDFGENTIPILVAVLVVFIFLDIFLLYKTCIYHQKLHKANHKEEYTLVRTDGGSSSDSEEEPELRSKNHHHTNNHKQNGTKMNAKNSSVNQRRHSNEYKDEDGYKETALFIAPSRTPK